jgi:hypothetical protein
MYRCLHAVLSITSLMYRGVEVQLNTFLMLALDKSGWLHSPATLPQAPTEKEAGAASEMIYCTKFL